MSIREVLGLPANTNLKAHRTYRIWYGMKSRVLKTWHHAYEKYAALGVAIDERWTGKRGFLNFLDDMGHPPSDRHSIERLDNHGAYTKSNCVWALPEQQNRNKSNLHYFDTPGGRMCLSEAARYYGVPPHLVFGRFYKGVSGPALFAAPKKARDYQNTYLRNGRWSATVTVDGKSKYLGTFDTQIAAYGAVLNFKRLQNA